MLSKKETANIILHVIFVATFVAIFFFTYTANVEKQMVKNQVGLIIKNLFGSTNFLDADTKLKIKEELKKMDPSDLSEEDALVKKNNKDILEYATKVMSITAVSGLMLSYYLFKYDADQNKGTYIDLLKENIILLAFVALTEFTFLHLVSENYVYGDANLVKKQILVSLKKYMSN